MNKINNLKCRKKYIKDYFIDIIGCDFKIFLVIEICYEFCKWNIRYCY